MEEQGQVWRSGVRQGGAESGREEQGQVWRSRVRQGGAGSGREEQGQAGRSRFMQVGAGSVETPSTSLTAFLCEVTVLPYLLETSAPSMPPESLDCPTKMHIFTRVSNLAGDFFLYRILSFYE